MSRRKQIIEEHFECDPWEEDWGPRFNIAPTQPVPVIRQHPKEPVRQISLMKWGLICSLGKGCLWRCQCDQRKVGNRSHEACIPRSFEIPQVPDSCRWAKTANGKQPYCFEVNDGNLFALAGLWDGWRDASGQWIKTCSILTTTPNAVTSAIHDRMPVILHPDSYDVWLDPGMTDVQVVSELLKPYDAQYMRCYPVSSRVNHVTNDDEECSRPVEMVQSQKSSVLVAK